MNRKYGWKPDPTDARDIKYSAPRRLISLPLMIDWRPQCSNVEQQEYLGSCYGNAQAGWYECLDNKEDGKYTDVSRLFIYYNARAEDGNENNDVGVYLRDGIKSLSKYGACDESLWPYVPSRFAEKPSQKAYRDGLKRKINAYHRASTLTDIKSALAEGIPVVFGFMVYESFERIGSDGIMPMPEPGEKVEGGHAVLAVGYDDIRRHLIVRNSWGPEFGVCGYFYMPYDFAEDPNNANDWWVILATGLKFKEEERYDPMPADTQWYIPITSIVRVVVDVWKRIFSSKQTNKEDSR